MEFNECRSCFRSLDAEKISEWLISEKIAPIVVEKLKGVGFRGEHFFSYEKENYLELELGIPLAEIIQIKVLHKKTFSVKPSPTTIKKDPASKVKASKDETQTTRKFGFPKSNEYTVGHLIPHEIGRGSNLLEPAREFKEFSLSNTNVSEEKLQKKFIEKIGKFASACMNSRVNGTIYFGVADSIEGKKHGEVVGMQVQQHQLCILEDIIHQCFRGSSPTALVHCTKEAKRAFDHALGPIQAMKLKDTSCKLVLEIDVEPNFERTNYLAFPVNLENKKELKYFIRDGPNSSPIPSSEKGIKKFLTHDISYNAHQRLQEERKMTQKRTELPAKLENTFLKNRPFIDDKHYQYILITSGLCSEECCRMKSLDSFEWVKRIKWKTVFDFGSESGLASWLQESTDLLIKPKEITGDEIKEKLEENPSNFDEEVKNLIGIGERTAWIHAGGNSTLKHWNSNLRKSMMRVFETLSNKSNIEPHSNIVCVICASSMHNSKKIATFVNDISSELDDGIASMIFLHKDPRHLKPIEEELLRDCEASEHQEIHDDISKRKIEIGWDQLNTFINENSRLQTISGKFVPTSNGLKTQLKREIIDIYKTSGLDILAMNECEELIDLDRITEFADAKNIEFLSGKQSGWEPYFFKEESDRIPFSKPVVKGLIERDIVGKTVKKLKHDEQRNDACITVTGINHLPGTGATTIGKHVLWKFRSNFRCILLDGKISRSFDYKKLATKILEFRSFGEHPSTVDGSRVGLPCIPVLIFIDNFSLQQAKALQRQIQDLVASKSIRHEKTLGMILFASQTYQVSCSQSSEEDIFLSTTFSDSEKKLFKSKLSELAKVNKIQPALDIKFICTLCNFTTAVKPNLEEHCKTSHSYTCDLCPFIGIGEATMEDHTSKKHAIPDLNKYYPCDTDTEDAKALKEELKLMRSNFERLETKYHEALEEVNKVKSEYEAKIITANNNYRLEKTKNKVLAERSNVTNGHPIRSERVNFREI